MRRKLFVFIMAIGIVPLLSCDLQRRVEKLESQVRILMEEKNRGSDMSDEPAVKEEPARLVVQNGHVKKIISLSISHNGKYIISCSEDAMIKLWTRDGSLLRTFIGHTHPVTCAAWSPDDALIASGSEDKTIRIWSLNGDLIKTFMGHDDAITCIAFSPDGKTIISGSNDNKINIWSLNDDLNKSISPPHNRIKNILFNSNGKYFLSFSINSDICLWSRDGMLIKDVKNNSETYSNILFLAGGKSVLTSCGKNIIDILSKYGYEISVIDSIQLKDFIADSDCETIRPNEKVVPFLVSDKRALCLLAREGLLMKVSKCISENVNWVEFSPDGKQLLSGYASGPSKIWSVNGLFSRSITTSHNTMMTTFRHDGKIIALSQGRKVNLYTNMGEYIGEIKVGKYIWSVAFSSDGNILATGSDDYRICLWDSKGKRINMFKAHDDIVLDVNFSPDGKKIVSCAGNPFKKSKDTNVKIWSLDGELLHTLEHSSGVWSARYSPDGSMIVSGSFDRTIRIWTSEGKLIQTIRGHTAGVTCVEFSPDTKMIASSSGSNFDSTDNTIKIWSLTGKLLNTLVGHTNIVFNVSFHPNGEFLASGSFDASTIVWDLKTGKPLITLLGLKDGSAIVHTPDGRFDFSDPKAKRYLAYVMGERVVELNDVFSLYYTPGLYQQVMSGTLGEARAGFINTRFEKPATVKILSPSMSKTQFAVEQEELDVMFRVSDTGGGVSSAEVRNNGIQKWESPEGTDFSKPVTVKIKLNPGVNQVSVTAYNKKRGPCSESFMISRKEADLKKDSRLFILSVGINEYKRPHQLSYCVNDATKMIESIKQGTSALFKEVVPVLLSDEKATRRGIEDELKKIVSLARTQDVVVLYFSGHGRSVSTLDGGKLFAFLPSDYPWIGEGEEEDILNRFGVTGDFIQEQVKGMDPNKVVLIMDCCQSGDVRLAFRAGDVTNAEMLQRLANGTGRFFLTSAAGKELARESREIKHGLFTYVMLQGLSSEGADYNRDGTVTVTELSSYVKMNFMDVARKYQGDGYRQSPVVCELGRSDLSEAACDFPLRKVR